MIWVIVGVLAVLLWVFVAVAKWLAPPDVEGCNCKKCGWYIHRRWRDLCYFYAPYTVIYKPPVFNPDDWSIDSFKKFKNRYVSQIEVDLIEKMSKEIQREVDNDFFIELLVESAVRLGFAKAEESFKCK